MINEYLWRPECLVEINALRTGRYVLVLDILGFRRMVEEGEAERAADVINKALKHFHRWEESNVAFVTISFSDTILFYQDPQGYGQWAFLDAYALSAMILTALLAQGIAARGAIAFGELIVRKDDDNRHNIFCGRAFNEAYDTQEAEKSWIGITLCRSALEPFQMDDCGAAGAIEKEGRWRRRPDGSALLNPFLRLEGARIDDQIGEITVPYDQWIAPEFPDELRAFRFLVETSREFEKQGDLTSSIALKYHNTVTVLQEMLSEECFQWAERVSASVTRSSHYDAK